MKTRPRFAGETLLPSRQVVDPRDVELFARELASFVPPDPFDVHAHLYPLGGVGFDFPPDALAAADGDVGLAAYRTSTAAWMGARCPPGGLFFGLPSSPRVDVPASNTFVAEEVARARGSAALMLVRPGDDPASVEGEMRRRGFVGFKAYHTFAARRDTPDAELDEYLPRWVWELAHAHRRVIMLHLVKPRALADAGNQAALRRHLAAYPDARLVLAHAARGFCAAHTVEGVAALAGFDNVYFDTSAVCESAALVAILGQFGARRLMFGTDFPVSSSRGRCVSVGDGFVWLTDDNLDWSASPYGRPTLVGIESLLALRQAVRLTGTGDAGVEAIFRENAVALLSGR